MKANECVILAALFLAFPLAASAQQYVHGYTKADGTYVQGYYRSTPNNTKLDNYSTRGNVNPYTGAVGTRDPYAPPQTYTAPVYTPPVYQAPVYQAPVYTPPVYQPSYTTDDQQQDDDSGACCKR